MKTKKGKILEAHINYIDENHCIITIAIEVKPKIFTALYKQCTNVSDSEIAAVDKKGKVVSEQKARDLFFLPDYKYIE